MLYGPMDSSIADNNFIGCLLYKFIKRLKEESTRSMKDPSTINVITQ